MAAMMVTGEHRELIPQLHTLAVRLAREAGQLARARRLGGFAIATKSTDTDLVTEVDREVEAWLASEIRAARPGDGILGEEGADETGSSRVRWVLDPIDGTVNFALGLPQYAVSVAAELDGMVVAGCVHNPESGELFAAALGGGATLEVGGGAVQRLAGPRSIGLARAVVGTGFGYAADRRARQGQLVAQLLPAVGDVRRLGAASLDLCAVACGRLDAFFEAGLNIWDYAAGLLIATEAGCVVSGLRGNPPGTRMTAVAGPDLAEAFFELLTALGVDLL